MKRQLFARYSLLVVVTSLLQLAIFGHMTIAGVHPLLPYLLAVSAGVVGGPQRGAVVGFAVGLLYDPLLATPLGLTALVLCLLGVAAGYAEETINAHSRLGISVLCLGCTALGVVLFAVVGELFGLSTLANSDVGRIIGIVASVNGLLAVVWVTACTWAEESTHHGRSMW